MYRLIKSKPPRPQEVHEDTKTTPGAIDDGKNGFINFICLIMVDDKLSFATKEFVFSPLPK